MNWRKLMATDLVAFLLRREQPDDGEFWPTFRFKENRELAMPRPAGFDVFWSNLVVRPGRRYREVLTLTRQLSVFVHANVDIVAGLQALSTDAPTYRLRKAGRDIADRLAAGELLADAIEAQRRFFPKVCCDIIRTGEQAGSLEAALDEVEHVIMDVLLLPRSLTAFLTYPIAVLIVQATLIVFLLIKVIPLFSEITAEFGTAPSAQFRFLISASDVLERRWPAFLLGAVLGIAAIVLTVRALRQSPMLSEVSGRMVTRIPLIRTLLVKHDLALAALIIEKSAKAGIPMNETLRNAAHIGVNPLYAQLLERLARRIEEGLSFADALEEEPRHLVPRSFCTSVAMGEQSGLLPQALDRIGRQYCREVTKVQRITLTILEPLGLIIPVACVLLVTTGWFQTYTILIEALLAQI